MKTRKGILVGALLAAVLILCVAGVKVSRLTRTTTFTSNSLFIVVTGETTKVTRHVQAHDVARGLGPWITNAPSGSATNAVSTLRTNGAAISSAATSLDFIEGTNIILRATNAAGVVTVQINSASVGEVTTAQLNTASNLTWNANGIYTNISLLNSNTVVVHPTANVLTNGWLLTNAVKIAGAIGGGTRAMQVRLLPGKYITPVNTLPSVMTAVENVSTYWETGAEWGSGTVGGDPAFMWDFAAKRTNCHILGTGRFWLTNDGANCVIVENSSRVFIQGLSFYSASNSAAGTSAPFTWDSTPVDITFDVMDWAEGAEYDCLYGPVGQGQKIRGVIREGIAQGDVFEFGGDSPEWGLVDLEIGIARQRGPGQASFMQIGGRCKVRGSQAFVSSVTQARISGADSTTNGIIAGYTIQYPANSTASPIGFQTPSTSSGLHLKNVTIYGPTNVDVANITNTISNPLTLENCTFYNGWASTNWARGSTPSFVRILGTLALHPFKPLGAQVTVLGTNYHAGIHNAGSTTNQGVLNQTGAGKFYSTLDVLGLTTTSDLTAGGIITANAGILGTDAAFDSLNLSTITPTTLVMADASANFVGTTLSSELTLSGTTLSINANLRLTNATLVPNSSGVFATVTNATVGTNNLPFYFVHSFNDQPAPTNGGNQVYGFGVNLNNSFTALRSTNGMIGLSVEGNYNPSSHPGEQWVEWHHIIQATNKPSGQQRWLTYAGITKTPTASRLGLGSLDINIDSFGIQDRLGTTPFIDINASNADSTGRATNAIVSLFNGTKLRYEMDSLFAGALADIQQPVTRNIYYYDAPNDRFQFGSTSAQLWLLSDSEILMNNGIAMQGTVKDIGTSGGRVGNFTLTGNAAWRSNASDTAEITIIKTNGALRVSGAPVQIDNTLSVSSLNVTSIMRLEAASMFLRGTNMWFDGGASSLYTNTFVANSGGVSNILATNIQSGQIVRLEIFPETGVTVGFPQFTAAQWGGAVPKIETNLWNVVDVGVHGSVTNARHSIVDYELLPGSQVTFATNHVTRAITIASTASGGGSSAFNYLPQQNTNYLPVLSQSRRMTWGAYWPNGATTPVGMGSIGTPTTSGTLLADGAAGVNNSHYGIILNVGGAAAQASINPSTAGIFNPTNSVFLFTASIQFSNSVGTNRMFVGIGGPSFSFGDDNTRCGWRAITGGSTETNWVAEYYNGSAFVQIHTNTAKTGSLHTLGIGNTNGTQIHWFVNGVSIISNATPGNINLGAAGGRPHAGSRVELSPTGTNHFFWQTFELIHEIVSPAAL